MTQVHKRFQRIGSRFRLDLAAVPALAAASAGTAAAIRAIGGRTARLASTTLNGRIAFSGLDGLTWQIYSVEPDGSGLAQLTQVLSCMTTPTDRPRRGPAKDRETSGNHGVS